MNSLLVISQVGLWILVTLLLVVVLALARQIGLLHRRIGPAGARMTREGPEVGEAAPPIDATDSYGRPVTLGTVRSKLTLLVFVSPGCSACVELLPAVLSIRRSERRHLEVLLVSLSTDSEENEKFFAAAQAADVSFVVSRPLAEAYGIVSPPHAVLVGADGNVKAKGLVNHLEHLESLLIAARSGYPSIDAYMRSQKARLATERPSQPLAASERAVS